MKDKNPISEKIAELFDRYKENPVELLIRLYQNGTSVVGLGENHDLASNHRFAKSIISPLQESVGLDYIGLELESFLQLDIDSYLKSGDEKYLQRVIDRAVERVKTGSPMQGRIDGDYFDILREARKLGIRVIAMRLSKGGDSNGTANYTALERDRYMEMVIPVEGKGIFYCGQLHVAEIGSKLQWKRGDSQVRLMRQESEESAGAWPAETLFVESLKTKGYDSCVAVDFQLHDDLRSLLWNDPLMLQFVHDFDSVIYHPNVDGVRK
ncbi:ChaN family lipoprotein [Candidatus Woesearchaeota archaeon]|nr:ChaN family lipoprotein [Candidatus Woesearchaeota archaeon]